MKKIALLILCVTCAGMSPAGVINIDCNKSGDEVTFSGQGAYSDPGNNYWNSAPAGQASNLLESDGTTVTGVSITTGSGSSHNAIGAIAHDMLGDYNYTRDTDSTISITGLSANTDYKVYAYLGGDNDTQITTVTLNGVTVAQTSAYQGTGYVEGAAGNYFVMEVTTDATGAMTGTFDAVSGRYGAIRGFQLIESEPAGEVTIVNSIEQLLTVVDQHDLNVKMTPGDYYLDEDDVDSGLISSEKFIEFSGSNCTYDFTDVTFNIHTNILNEFGNISTNAIYISGHNNHIFGLTIRNIDNERPYRSALDMRVFGDYNKIEDVSLYVRGSEPYAYGDLFGKGSGYVIKHWKHSALLINGIGNHILNCYVESQAYGHGIFMQGAIDTLVEGCYVKGFTRTTDEVLAEEGTGSKADLVDFETVWGWPVPPGYTFSISEDGIRCYNDGTTSSGTRDTANTTVKNCTVEGMRGGVTIGFSNGTNSVSGCTVIGSEGNYWPGNDDSVVHCQGEAAYAAIINNPYQNDNDQSYSVTVLRETDVYGQEQLAYIAGSGHDITFLNSGIQPRPYSQMVQMGGRKLGMRYMENVEGRNHYSVSNTTVTNWTDQKVALAADPNSSNCTVSSYGPVTDDGTGNTVSLISPVTVTASASTSTMYNTVDGNTGTHWTVDGEGQWIQYDLGMTRNLYAVSVQWLDGLSRRYFFDIQTSDSGSGPWTTVYSGSSSGTTDDFEEYDFHTQNARYIRITGYGNSVDNTIQIVDFDVDLKDRFAMVKAKSENGSNIAQNTLDGDLNTRWSAYGDGQWIQYDLLKEKTINAVSLAWHNGNTRTYSFDIMTSDHPMGPWTTVYSGSSSGTTLQLEEHEFTPVSARFLRVTGYGNSQDDWNNITEIFINSGTYILDGDLNFDGRVDLLDVAALSGSWQSGYTMDDLLDVANNWLTGTERFSLLFDGVDNYVEVAHNTALDPGTNSWTTSFWMRSDTPNQSARMISKRANSGSYTQYTIGLSNGDSHTWPAGSKITFLFREDSGAEKGGYTTSDVDFSDWTHVAVVLDRTAETIYVYINGVSVPVTLDYDIALPNITNSEPLYIGGNPDSQVFYEGLLDEVRLYDRALSDVEIGSIASVTDDLVSYWNLNEGSGDTAYDSVSDHDGTIYGAQWISEQ